MMSNNPKQVARHLIYAMNISVYSRLRLIPRRFDFDAFLQANRKSTTLYPLLSSASRPLSIA